MLACRYIYYFLSYILTSTWKIKCKIEINITQSHNWLYYKLWYWLKIKIKFSILGVLTINMQHTCHVTCCCHIQFVFKGWFIVVVNNKIKPPNLHTFTTGSLITSNTGPKVIITITRLKIKVLSIDLQWHVHHIFVLNHLNF